MIQVLIDSLNTAVQEGLTALCRTESDMEIVDTAVTSHNAIPSITPPTSPLWIKKDGKTIRAAAPGNFTKAYSGPTLLQTLRSIHQ